MLLLGLQLEILPLQSFDHLDVNNKVREATGAWNGAPRYCEDKIAGGNMRDSYFDANDWLLY